MKDIRFKREKKLKQLCKVNQGAVRLFSDESNFTVDGAFNSQNNCWLAQTKSNVPPVMKTKHPSKIVVFRLATSNSKIMPAHIFPDGLKVNTKVYVDLLEKVVLPWLAKTYPLGTKFMWIQDSAPAHISKKADLNPCDF